MTKSSQPRGSMSKSLHQKECSEGLGKPAEPAILTDGFVTVKRRRRRKSQQDHVETPVLVEEQEKSSQNSGETPTANMSADLEINADLPEHPANYRSLREQARQHLIVSQNRQIAKLRKQNEKLVRRLTNKGRQKSQVKEYPEGLGPEDLEQDESDKIADQNAELQQQIEKNNTRLHELEMLKVGADVLKEAAKPAKPTVEPNVNMDGIPLATLGPVDTSETDPLIDEIRAQFLDASAPEDDEPDGLSIQERATRYALRVKEFWSPTNCRRIGKRCASHFSLMHSHLTRVVSVSYKDLDQLYAPIIEAFQSKKELMYNMCIRVIMYCVALQSCRTAKDVVMTTIGVCGQHLTYDHISSLLEFVYPEGIFDDFSAKLSKFRSMALCIEEVPCYDMLKKGLSLCVFFGMKPANMIVSSEMMTGFVKKFEKDVAKNFGMHKLVDAVLALSDYTANAIACIKSGGNLSKFLLPSNLHNRYADTMATFLLIENGTYQREHGDNLDKFDAQVKELAKEVEISLSGNGLTPHFKTVYTEYLKNLKNMINKLHIIKQNSNYRIKPYCVCFYGKSQIGKSMATNMLIRTYGAVSGDPVRTEEIYYHSETANFQTGFTNNTRVYVLDDMDTIRKEVAQYISAMISTTIHNVNNVPSMINHADISQKGVNFERNELTVMTANKMDLDIQEKVVYGPAAVNRIKFVEVTLDPEYATENGTLDYSKLKFDEKIPYAHHYCQRYTIKFTIDQKTQMPTSWHREDIGEKIPFAQWLRETALDMKEHYFHQKCYLEEMAAIQSVSCCDKCWMPLKGGYCVCPPAITTTVPEADRQMEQFFSNPRISAIMGIFNIWEGFCVPIGNHFIEQLVLRSTLMLTLVTFRAFKGMQVHATPYYMVTILILWILRENLYLFANPVTLLLIAFSLVMWILIVLKALVKLYKAHVRKEIHAAAIGQSAYMASILGVTSLCTAAAAIKVIQSLMATSTPEGNLTPNNMDEVQARNNEKNEWLTPSRVDVPKPVTLSTMTKDQVLEKLKNNCIYFTATSDKGVEYTRGTAWLVDSNHVMLPHHTYELMQKETPSPFCVTLYRGKDTRQSVVTFLANPAPVKCSREKTVKDFVVFQSTKAFPVQSILKFLPEATPAEVVCEMMTVDANLKYSTQTVKYSPQNGMTNGASCTGNRISQRGSRHALQFPTKAGDCLAPLVAQTNPHYIVSFHIGAREEPMKKKQGISFDLLRGELEDAIARTRGTYILADTAEKPVDWPEGTDKSESLIYQPTANIEEVHLYDCNGRLAFNIGDYHERSNARFIRDDPNLATPSVDFVGEDPSLRHRTFSSVSRTFLSPYLELEGNPCKWDKPNFESNRNHATYLEIGIRPMRDIDPLLLNRAQIDYLSVVPGLITRTGWPTCKPIPLTEALNGQDGSRFIHSIKEDTSGGFGFKGKKHRHMETWYRECDGKKMFTPLPHLCEGVERILNRLAKGQMSCPIVKTALKDEPTLLPQFNNGKEKVRVFSVYPMDFFLVGKMLFAPVLEFLQSFPLELELLQGVNVTTDEWEQIACHILDFQSDSIIEGDFSKMDVRLSGQIIRAAGACLIEMARYLGYPEVALRQMESYICDIALTSWSYAGLLMLLDGWNTSGNLLTIVINGLALALLHRTAYLSYATSLKPHGNIPVFRDVIRMGFVGDDSLGSSRLPWYNMKYLQEYFGSVGMVYTDGRKSSVVPLFIDALDASLCKRKFRFEPKVGRRVAPIELDSLYKSLHCMMKSSTDEVTIVTGNVDQTLRELARHDEVTFTRERETILNACEKAGILHLVKYASRSYDEWWEDITKRLAPIKEFDEFVENDSSKPLEDSWVVISQRAHSRPRVAQRAPFRPDSKENICLVFLRLVWKLIWLYFMLRTFSALVPVKIFSSATEFTNMNMGTETQKEVMSFGDQQPHWVVGMNNQEERTAHAGSTTDTNDGFMFRPLKIYSAQWTPGASLFDTIDPWSLFFEDPRVINRVAHFRNLRCSLKLKILINGNSFYYGRVMAAYQPLPEVDGVTVFREGIVQDFVEASQRLHVMLNPTNSEGGEMTLPFIYPKNYAVIPEREWNKLGRLTLASFNVLRHANGSTKPVTITILAYCEPDLDLSLPTSVIPTDTTPQGFEYPEGDEYGMISTAAHTVANISGKLANAPTIGPFARATQIGFDAVGSIASIFGFSRPRTVDENNVTVVRMHGTTAATNQPDTARTLALDAKKEVTVDPRVTNAPPTDEMAIVPLAKRESFLTQFLWEKVDGPDTSLFQVRVGPVQGAAEGNDRHITPACFVSVPFNYWTGSIEYRIQVVASGLHRGRLRIAWDPYCFDSTKFNVYNVNYSKVIDISECTDLTFKVGWGQETNYAIVPEMQDLPNFITSGNYPTPKDGYNGVLGIFVVNTLTSPSDDPNPVEINVFTRACDDFEVNTPTKLQTLQYEPSVTGATIIPRAETVMPARQYFGAPHRVLFRVNTAANTDPFFARYDVSGSSFGYFQETSQHELLVYSPTGGSGQVELTATSIADVTITPTFQGVTFPPEFIPNGGEKTITLSYNDLSPGIHYIPLNIHSSVAGMRLLQVGTQIPANWKAMTTPAEELKNNSTSEFAHGYNYERSNIAYTNSEKTLPGPLNYDISAAIGSRYTLQLLDGGTLSGIVHVNDTGAEFGPNVPVCWGPVLSGEFPRIADPITRFNSPWFPIWGTCWWFQDDPDYPEGNCLRRQVGPPPEETNESLSQSFQNLEEVLQSLEICPPPCEPNFVAEYPEGDGQVAETNTTVDDDNQNAPETQQVDTTMGPMAVSGANQVYFGEQVGSIRQILKRYEADMAFNLLSPTPSQVAVIDLAQYPILNTENLTGNVQKIKYTSNLINWFMPAYICVRGSMRVKIFAAAGANTDFGGITLTRVSANEYIDAGVPIKGYGTSVDLRCQWSGSEYSHLGPQGEGQIEVELPWYSRYRFTPARSVNEYDLENHIERDWYRVAIRVAGSTYLIANYSIGEDFSLSHFLSTPIIKPST